MRPSQRCGATADEVDDFDLIAVADQGIAEQRPLEHRQIVLDRDAARIDVEAVEELGDRDRPRHLDVIAVDCNLQDVFDSSVLS